MKRVTLIIVDIDRLQFAIHQVSKAHRFRLFDLFGGDALDIAGDFLFGERQTAQRTDIVATLGADFDLLQLHAFIIFFGCFLDKNVIALYLGDEAAFGQHTFQRFFARHAATYFRRIFPGNHIVGERDIHARGFTQTMQ